MTKQGYVIGAVGIVAAVGIGGFLYVSRPLATPSNGAAPLNNSAQVAVTGESVYVIDSTQSTVTYELDETLGGSPVHVVGTTNAVTGKIMVNLTNPNLSRVEPISVNARTFKTDSERRDNTVGRTILKSEDAANEFIVFKVTSVVGAPAKIIDGQEFSATVNGDLTIAGVTKPVTFSAKVTLQGSKFIVKASTVIAYADYGLTIPKLPFIAWVDNKVLLNVSLVANKL